VVDVPFPSLARGCFFSAGASASCLANSGGGAIPCSYRGLGFNNERRIRRRGGGGGRVARAATAAAAGATVALAVIVPWRWRSFDAGTDQILPPISRPATRGRDHELAAAVPEPASIALLGAGSLPSRRCGSVRPETDPITPLVERLSRPEETGVTLVAPARPTATFGPATQLFIADHGQYWPQRLLSR